MSSSDLIFDEDLDEFSYTDSAGTTYKFTTKDVPTLLNTYKNPITQEGLPVDFIRLLARYSNTNKYIIYDYNLTTLWQYLSDKNGKDNKKGTGDGKGKENKIFYPQLRNSTSCLKGYEIKEIFGDENYRAILKVCKILDPEDPLNSGDVVVGLGGTSSTVLFPYSKITFPPETSYSDTSRGGASSSTSGLYSKDDKCNIAVKVMWLKDGEDETPEDALYRFNDELTVFKFFSSRGIGPEFYGACLDSDIVMLMIFMELWDGVLSKPFEISDEIFNKLLDQIELVHNYGYVHGDILPKNILVKVGGSHLKSEVSEPPLETSSSDTSSGESSGESSGGTSSSDLVPYSEVPNPNPSLNEIPTLNPSNSGTPGHTDGTSSTTSRLNPSDTVTDITLSDFGTTTKIEDAMGNMFRFFRYHNRSVKKYLNFFGQEGAITGGLKNPINYSDIENSPQILDYNFPFIISIYNTNIKEETKNRIIDKIKYFQGDAQLLDK